MGKHSQPVTQHTLSRRSFVLGALGIPLVGAAGGLTRAESRGRGGGPSAASEISTAPSSISPSPTPTLNSVMPPPIDIAARYRGLAPHDWGLDISGITQTLSGKSKTVALTFDACGGPAGSAVDEQLLATLIDNAIPATLFFNKRWIDANPARAKQLADNPLFQIENHGTSHKPLSVNGRSAYGIAGTATVDELVAEIEGNRAFMRDFLGVESTWFRSGTAHYDDLAINIAKDLGLGIAGFDVNGDFGATASSGSVTSNLQHSAPGSIAIMHMNQPRGGTAAGVKAAIPLLTQAGFKFVTMGKSPVT